ncbi:hypothetical protein D3C81_1788420 [compost metagenome]
MRVTVEWIGQPAQVSAVVQGQYVVAAEQVDRARAIDRARHREGVVARGALVRPVHGHCRARGHHGGLRIDDGTRCDVQRPALHQHRIELRSHRPVDVERADIGFDQGFEIDRAPQGRGGGDVGRQRIDAEATVDRGRQTA